MGLACAAVLPLRAELFVSSHDSSRILRFNETNGVFLDVFVSNSNGLLNAPHGLAFGLDGNLYVASAGNDRILRYNGTNGAYFDTFVEAGAGGLDYPVAVVFRGDGYLYVSSQLNDRVLRFSARPTERSRTRSSVRARRSTALRTWCSVRTATFT